MVKANEMDMKLDLEADFVDEDTENTDTEGIVSKEDTIVKQYKLGVPVQHIIDTFNLSNGYLYSVLRRKGIKGKRNKEGSFSTQRLKELTNQDVNDVVQDYKQGYSLKRIYQKYNINKTALYKILDSENIERRVNSLLKDEIDPSNVNPDISVSTHNTNLDDNQKYDKKFREDAILTTEFADGCLYVNINKESLQGSDVKVLFS